MFNLIKKVLATHASIGEDKILNLDVKLVALKLWEMQMKINCTLQGNYFTKEEQLLATKLYVEEEQKSYE